MENCDRISCCRWCRNCVFCWRGCFYKDEFLLEEKNFYEEITPQEWKILEEEARKLKNETKEKIALVETNGLLPFEERSTAVSQNETSKPWRSLVDYCASDFLDVESTQEKKRLNTEKFRSYSQPNFLAEMWGTSGGSTPRVRSLKEIFHRKKYAKFTNEEDLTMDKLPRDELKFDSDSGKNKPAFQQQQHTFLGRVNSRNQEAVDNEPKSRLKLQTKILTKRSQRPGHEKERQDLSRSFGTLKFNDYGQIEATISFAAHVRRQGPGFSASCVQTLRTCDFNTLGDLFQTEVQNNVTFNPLFEDDDSDEDKRVLPRRYRLYTIDEESEAYDSGS